MITRFFILFIIDHIIEFNYNKLKILSLFGLSLYDMQNEKDCFYRYQIVLQIQDFERVF